MINERYQDSTANTPATATIDRTMTTTTSPTDKYRAGIDHVRFWVGASLAAAISAMAALVGLLLIRGVLNVPVLVTSNHPLDVTAYVLITAALVVGASALYNLMLHVAPHPTSYYGALADGRHRAGRAPALHGSGGPGVPGRLAGLNLVVGLFIAFLVPMAAVQARR